MITTTSQTEGGQSGRGESTYCTAEHGMVRRDAAQNNTSTGHIGIEHSAANSNTTGRRSAQFIIKTQFWVQTQIQNIIFKQVLTAPWRVSEGDFPVPTHQNYHILETKTAGKKHTAKLKHFSELESEMHWWTAN